LSTYIENVSPTDVRNITGLTTDDISDVNLTAVISGSIAQLNGDIFIRHEDVELFTIDAWRENVQDGSNTTYYLPFYPIADFNNDGKLDTSDVEIYAIEDNGTDSAQKKTDFTISSILDDKYGKIQLSTAPTGGTRLFASWSSSPLEIETPDPLIKRAVVQLASAMAYTKINAGKIASFRIGKISVMKQSQAFKTYLDMYYRTVQQIQSKDLIQDSKFELI